MNKPVEHDIDQALAALREAPPPNGLETRILASLRQRESHPPLAPRRDWLPAALVLASASVLVAALLFRASTHAPEPPSARPPTPSSILVAKAALFPPPPPQRRPRILPLHLSPAFEPIPLTSFPAPPAPLTQQERLLLRVAHAGDRQDFDLLNPETVARELAENIAEFNRFFPPPPPPETSVPATPAPALQETPSEAHPVQQ